MNHLEEFKNSVSDLFERTLEEGEFVTELKSKFWLPGKEWLADIIPWGELKKYQIKLNNIHMLSDSMGLITVSFTNVPTLFTTFSLLKVDDRWFIDWQNNKVWLEATKTWKRKNANNLEIRFFETFPEDEIDTIFNNMSPMNQWIHKELGADQEELIIVFGYDSYEYLLSGIEHNPSQGGGNSRGKLILISAKFPNLKNVTFESLFFESILLHEMIHEYTFYDKQWNGSIENPSLKLNLLNEGVATYYQWKYFVEQIRQMNISATHSKADRIKLGIMEALNYNQPILELLSNQKFNEVNLQNPAAGNPAYYLGASLYAYFLQELGFAETRRIYSNTGSMDSQAVKELLANYLDEEKYQACSKKYFDDLLGVLQE